MLTPLRLVRDQQLQQQIFEQLRDLILSSRLQPGARMPSSRMMAEQFGISRMTVLLAYERLIAEGYLETRPAAGTFVAQSPLVLVQQMPVDASSLSLAHQPRSDQAAEEPSLLHNATRADLPVGRPDPSLFPAQRWRSLLKHAVDRLGTRFEPEHPAGHPPLRDAIARWLSTSRGLPVTAEQIILARSRQQALHLVALVASHSCEGRRALARSAGSGRNGEAADDLWNNGTRIVVEDPGDRDAAAAMASVGSALLRVPVDADGLCTGQLPEGGAALIHVTPEHQRPLGVLLSRQRRTELLYWAERAGALVLEDDIDGELRYGSANIPSLMSLDRSERVILLGGFGASLGPWLDQAYVVLPRWLVPYVLTARRRIDESRGGLEHAVLAEYLESSGYPRHLHRLTKTYASRRDELLNGLRLHFGETTRVMGQQAGLHLAWFPTPDLGSAAAIAVQARQHGLEAASPRDDVVLLGFGVSEEHHIATRFSAFADALLGGSDAMPAIAAMPVGVARANGHSARI